MVCVSAGEMPPDLMIGSSFEAYSISCQGSTLCPKQFSKSQPKIITLMWQLTAIISSDLLRCTQKWKTHTHFLFHLQRFYSRNKIITRMLNHLHSWGCTQVTCSIHVAECHKCGSFQIVLLAARSGVSTQLSGTHELIIFFFKTLCWKALWPEGSLVCCGVWKIPHTSVTSPCSSLDLSTVCDPPATWNTTQTLSEVILWLQCLGCLIQFRIIHFWPEHLWTTRRRPKLASLDISTSKHRPVSLLMIGPFCTKYT